MIFFKKKKNGHQDEGRYRAAAYVFVKSGLRETTAILPGGEAAVIDDFSAGILSLCTDYLTLESHARSICAMPQFGPGAYHAVMDNLVKYVREGLMVRYDSAPAAERGSAHDEKEISSVSVLGSGRMECDSRCLEELMENCARSGRRPLFSFFLSSSDSGKEKQYIGLFEDLKKRYGFDLYYCFSEQKKDFINSLPQDRGLTEIMEHALSGGRGGNLNAALLYNSGDKFLCVDCSAGFDFKYTAAESGALMFTSSDPLTMRADEERENAGAADSGPGPDIIGEHEKFLGRRISCLPGNIEFHDISPGFYRNVADGTGIIAVTFNGISGVPSDRVSAVIPGAHGLPGIPLNEEAGEINFSSIGADDYTVTDSVGAVPGLMGIDCSIPPPPFMPGLICPESFFLRVLNSVNRRAFTAHLPFFIRYGTGLSYALDEKAFPFYIDEIMRLIAGSFYMPSYAADVQSVLEIFAADFNCLASMDSAALRDCISEITALENSRRMRNGHDEQSLSAAGSRPVINTAAAFAAEGPLEELRAALRNYGALAGRWNDIYGLAHRLKSEGRGLCIKI